jgi:hypothetical protein
MKITKVKILKYLDNSKERILLECRFDNLDYESEEQYDFFTACKNDIEPHGREIFQKAISGEYGKIEEYVEPMEEDVIKELLDTKILELKNECSKRIGIKYKSYTQRNIDRTAWILLRKNVNGKTLNKEEISNIEEQDEMHTYIEDLRETSKEIEEKLLKMNLKQLQNFDVVSEFDNLTLPICKKQ